MNTEKNRKKSEWYAEMVLSSERALAAKKAAKRNANALRACTADYFYARSEKFPLPASDLPLSP